MARARPVKASVLWCTPARTRAVVALRSSTAMSCASSRILVPTFWSKGRVVGAEPPYPRALVLCEGGGGGHPADGGLAHVRHHGLHAVTCQLVAGRRRRRRLRGRGTSGRVGAGRDRGR